MTDKERQLENDWIKFKNDWIKFKNDWNEYCKKDDRSSESVIYFIRTTFKEIERQLENFSVSNNEFIIKKINFLIKDFKESLEELRKYKEK